MNMKKSAEHTCGLPMAVIAACAILMIGFGAQAVAASDFGPVGSDGKGIAAGLEVAVHPDPAEQPTPNPPPEIGPVTPSGNAPEAKRPAWITANRSLLVLAFLGGIVIVGFVAVKMIRKKRKPDAN